MNISEYYTVFIISFCSLVLMIVYSILQDMKYGIEFEDIKEMLKELKEIANKILSRKDDMK